MKKRFLSLALALVMGMALAAPAFAAESKWKLEVSGKPDAQVFVGKKTFTVRDWAVSGTYEDEYGDSGNIWTKTDTHEYTAENLCVLSKGDVAVFTKGGESFEALYLTAWSDPDGDGVYDQRIIDLFSEDFYSDSDFLPADAAGPLRTLGAQSWYFFYVPSPAYFELIGGAPGEYGFWDPVCTGGTSQVTELKMAPDMLLNIYGPNTIVNIATPEKDWSCNILVEGNITQPTQPAAPSFTDVKEGDYFAQPVAWAVENKITNGTSEDTFSPNENCTVAQILTFLSRAKGSPEPAGTASLPGVDTGAYYYKPAAWALEQGLTDSFSADAPCTRSMVVTYLWKLAGSPAAATSKFSDVPAGADYAQAVAWAVDQGITSGTSGTTFSPNDTCTRGQIVTFLYRAFVK